MANATSTQLQELYVAYFGRAADPTGLDYWTEKGTTQAAFAAHMHAQAEFKDVYGSKSVEAQVNQIYKNLFDREADVTGLTYWTQEINLGNLKVAEIATHLIWAAQNNSGSEDDKTALSNRTDAAVAYTAEVKKSTANILAYAPTTTDPWVAGDNINEGVSYLSGIDKDTAYTAAGITASVAKFDAVAAADAKSLVFTKDVIDSLTGGAGNDTFTGDSNTVTAADSATGGAGTDTIKLTGTTTIPSISGIEVLELNNFTNAALNLSTNEYDDVTTLRADTVTVTDATWTFQAGQKIILDDLTGAEAEIEVAGDLMTTADITITDSGSNTSEVDIDLNSTKTTVLNITENGTVESYLTILNTGAKAKTVNIDADYKLQMTDIAIATTIDASESSGEITIGTTINKVVYTGSSGVDYFNNNVADGIVEMTINTGAGDDTIKLTNLNAATDLIDSKVTINGGAGTDTLSLDAAMAVLVGALSTTNITKKGLSNLEKVSLLDENANGASLGMSNFGANYLVINSDSSNDSIITGMTSGATVEFGTAVDVQGGVTTSTDEVDIQLSDKAGSGDVVNLIIKNTATAGVFNISAQEVEKVTIDASSSELANSVELDAPHLTELVLDTGTTNLTVNFAIAGQAATLISSVDATAADSTGGILFYADDSALAGVTYKGSTGGDTVLGGDLGDEITAGSGNDSIDAHIGTNTVDISSGGTDEIVVLSATGKTTVTGFATSDIVDVQTGSYHDGESSVSSTVSSAIDPTAHTTIIVGLNASTSSLLAAGSETIADFTDTTDVAAYLEEGFDHTEDEEFFFILNDGTNSYGYHVDEDAGDDTIDAGNVNLTLVVNNYVLGSADVVQTT